MRQHGFTIIELIVVVAIIGTLLTIGTLNFNQMMRKSAIENQTKAMYADLMSVRVQSMFQKRGQSVLLGPFNFSAYSSNYTLAAPVVSKTLRYQITWNGTASGVVDFDSRGIAKTLRSICVEPSDNPATYDSIIISQTRIQMGKRNTGKGCDDANIVIK